MLDSGTSSWNTFNISENTSGINVIGLNEEENPWKPSDTGKLINPLETPNTESQTPKEKDLENLLRKESSSERPLRNLYEGTSNLRFGPDKKENPFSRPLSEQILVLPTFPTWESTDDTYYYNLLNRKEPAKRKVTLDKLSLLPHLIC